MKIKSILGIATAMVFASAASVFAAEPTTTSTTTPTTQADCELASMQWDEAQGKCLEK